MFLRTTTARCVVALLVVGGFVSGAKAASPEGGFYVHANEQRSNSDSQRSITFYDADELNTGSASPIFSVQLPGDQWGPGTFNAEEISGIATDPATGDVYVLSFDSGSDANNSDPAVPGGSPADTGGSMDLYRINFATVYDHWSTNFQGLDARAQTGVPGGQLTELSGLAPNIPAGAPAGGFDDYVTYGSTPLFDSGVPFADFQFDVFNAAHSNVFQLPGAVEKIGEIQRNETNGAQFGHFYSLEFIDADTLVMIDDSRGSDASESNATEHTYRLLKRVSTSPGAATADLVGGTSDVETFANGGFNLGTTESWESVEIGKVELDFAPTGATLVGDYNDSGFVGAADYTVYRDALAGLPGVTLANETASVGVVNQLDYDAWAGNFGESTEFTPVGHSEPESLAFHEDTAAGVRGFWVTESDSSGTTRGDDIAFAEIDANGNFVGYRELNFDGSFAPSFSLDDDPFNDTTANDGQADNIFVDADTGDLIIIESGFGDTQLATDEPGDFAGLADHEPGILRLSIDSYDDGSGRIDVGAWSEKVILNPSKDGGGDADFLERGAYAAYDSENDLVYFFNPGGPTDYDFGPNGVDDNGPGEPGSDDVDIAFQMDIQIVDLATGATTTLLNVDDSVGFLNPYGDLADFFTLPPAGVASVPEPTAASLLVIAAFGIAGRQRR